MPFRFLGGVQTPKGLGVLSLPSEGALSVKPIMERMIVNEAKSVGLHQQIPLVGLKDVFLSFCSMLVMPSRLASGGNVKVMYILTILGEELRL